MTDIQTNLKEAMKNLAELQGQMRLMRKRAVEMLQERMRTMSDMTTQTYQEQQQMHWSDNTDIFLQGNPLLASDSLSQFQSAHEMSIRWASVDFLPSPLESLSYKDGV